MRYPAHTDLSPAPSGFQLLCLNRRDQFASDSRDFETRSNARILRVASWLCVSLPRSLAIIYPILEHSVKLCVEKHRTLKSRDFWRELIQIARRKEIFVRGMEIYVSHCDLWIVKKWSLVFIQVDFERTTCMATKKEKFIRKIGVCNLTDFKFVNNFLQQFYF